MQTGRAPQTAATDEYPLDDHNSSVACTPPRRARVCVEQMGFKPTSLEALRWNPDESVMARACVDGVSSFKLGLFRLDHCTISCGRVPACLRQYVWLFLRSPRIGHEVRSTWCEPVLAHILPNPSGALQHPRCWVREQVETGTLVEWVIGKGITHTQILQLGPEEDNLESTPVVPGGTPFTWLFTTPGIYTYRSQVRLRPHTLHIPPLVSFPSRPSAV
eukprot:3299907-Pyramimonas_sp.AAC.2